MQDTTNKTNLKTFQNLYENKDYTAAEAFLKSVKNDIGEWNYHYNLGVIKGHQDELAVARYHYLQALKTDDGSKELQVNLNNIEEKLSINVHEKPQGLSDHFFKQVLGTPDILWSTISLLILVLGLAFIRKSFKKLQVLILVTLSSLPLTFYFWFMSQGHFISQNEINIYEGPSEIFKGQYSIPTGIQLLGETNGEWIKIYYPSKFGGWIKKENVINLRKE